MALVMSPDSGLRPPRGFLSLGIFALRQATCRKERGRREMCFVFAHSTEREIALQQKVRLGSAKECALLSPFRWCRDHEAPHQPDGPGGPGRRNGLRGPGQPQERLRQVVQGRQGHQDAGRAGKRQKERWAEVFLIVFLVYIRTTLCTRTGALLCARTARWSSPRWWGAMRAGTPAR